MGMAQRVVSMEAKLLAVFSSGVPLKVTALCRDLEISRQTLYKYRRRFEAEGPAGLVERSRRPHSSPGRVSDATVEAIIRLRKDLPLECGAQTIAYHLTRRGETPEGSENSDVRSVAGESARMRGSDDRAAVVDPEKPCSRLATFLRVRSSNSRCRRPMHTSKPPWGTGDQ